MYADVRYEGGVHGTTGVPEPDLTLTDDATLIAASNTGLNESVAYMGMLGTLLQWHHEDPPDSLELYRNDIVYSFQGNRNPFIDHPEWADCLFGAMCGGGGDMTPPAPPTGLVGLPGNSMVDLDWSDNLEPDLAGYDVMRASNSGGPYLQLNAGLLFTSFYWDGTAVNDMTYHYVVTAIDLSGNESATSFEVSATPMGSGGPPATTPWINELHYDNSGADIGEFVEIAGPAGLDLNGWTVWGYNGNGGGEYNTIALAGVLTDQQGCMGTLAFGFTGMQNGSPDALALVDPSNTVVEFLGYEGSVTATEGPAAGMSSIDIGVAESFTTPIGFSLQRGGTGGAPGAFTWQAQQADTPGAPNLGQVLDGCVNAPPSAPSGLVATGGDGQVSLAWNTNTEPDLDGYHVHRATTTGGPYTRINAGLVLSTVYFDTAVTNDTSYFYVVTAVDLSGMESPASNEVSATPADTTPPSAPRSLVAAPGDALVALDWLDNDDPDLLGYHVRRATTPGGPYASLTSLPLPASNYLDTGLVNGTSYFYIVTAVDLSGNESTASNEVEVTPTWMPPLAPRRLPPSTPVQQR